MQLELKRPTQFLLQVLPWTLFLYLVAIYTSMAGMEIFGWLSATLILGVLVLQWDRPVFPMASAILPVDWVLLALLGVVTLGAFIAAPPGANEVMIIGSMRWILLFFLVRLGLRMIWSDSMPLVLVAITGLAALIALYNVFQHFTGLDLIRPDRPLSKVYFGEGLTAYRVRGMFGHPLTYAHSVALFLCFPLALFFLRAERSKGLHFFMGLTGIASLISLILTFTRGAWIAAAAALVIMALYAGRRVAMILFISGALALSGAFAFSPELRERVTSIADVQNQSNQERVNLWKANLLMFQENPILGVGYGENERIIQQYFDKMGIEDGFGGHAHNNYLQFLSGTGAVGFALFVFFSLYFLYISHRLWFMIPESRGWERALVLGAIGAQVALHVGGLTECNFKDAEVNHQYMFILAIVAVLYQKYSSERGWMIVRPKGQERGEGGI